MFINEEQTLGGQDSSVKTLAAGCVFRAIARRCTSSSWATAAPAKARPSDRYSRRSGSAAKPAIVYDPAMEYLPQFYNEARGDVILNPLDARCPFWTPGDEVPHEAEALTLAASLFPDQGRENRFFVEAPRKIFAHLINLKPTPQELTYWMCNAEEIDKRVEGTELAAMIDRGAANQRSGVSGVAEHGRRCVQAAAHRSVKRSGDGTRSSGRRSARAGCSSRRSRRCARGCGHW